MYNSGEQKKKKLQKVKGGINLMFLSSSVQPWQAGKHSEGIQLRSVFQTISVSLLGKLRRSINPSAELGISQKVFLREFSHLWEQH